MAFLSPLSTRELGRRPGNSRRVEITADAGPDLGSGVVTIPIGDRLELDLLLESVQEGVLVTGTVFATARGICVRCLDDLEVPLEVGFQELFTYPERAQAAADAGEQDVEQWVVSAEHVDIEPVVRDALVLALPFQPACRPDCPGLCPQCGVRLADDPAHQHDSTDLRWSALEGFFDQKES